MAWASALGSVAVVLAALGSAAHALTDREPRARTAPAQVGAEPVLLDVLTADFVEDEPGARVLAALEARLLRQGEHTWVSVVASPVGPRVVAPPGALGVAGYNRISAKEIGMLVRGEHLAVQTHGPRGRAEGRVALGAVREVLERRLHADGSVSHEPIDYGEPSCEVVFEVDVAGHGTHEVEVLASGRVRVHVRCRHDREGGRLLVLESFGAHHGDQP